MINLFGMLDKKLFGTATVGSKGQVVIPADAREELDIKAGDRFYVVGSARSKWVGLIKEEQLREIIAQITSNVENVNDLLEEKK